MRLLGELYSRTKSRERSTNRNFMAKVIRTVNESTDEFVREFNKLMTSRATWEVWADFVTLSAISISNAVDKKHFQKWEKEYMTVQSKYTQKEMTIISRLFALTVMALEREPWQDFLGSLYMNLDLGNHWKGQFFTPYDVTRVMAKITGGNIERQISEKGYISVNDCACGGGATLIAMAEEAYMQLKDTKLNWQNHIMFVAQDIDAVTAKMCYIQLSLLGCAGYVKIGDSLSDPIRQGDNDEKYWYTPMWFSDVWHYRRLWRSLDKLFKPNENECYDLRRENKGGSSYYYYYYDFEESEAK